MIQDVCMCVTMCAFKFDFRLNRLLQITHSNGFSPVCTTMCRLRLPRQLNVLLQKQQVLSSVSDMPPATKNENNLTTCVKRSKSRLYSSYLKARWT